MRWLGLLGGYPKPTCLPPAVPHPPACPPLCPTHLPAPRCAPPTCLHPAVPHPPVRTPLCPTHLPAPRCTPPTCLCLLWMFPEKRWLSGKPWLRAHSRTLTMRSCGEGGGEGGVHQGGWDLLTGGGWGRGHTHDATLQWGRGQVVPGCGALCTRIHIGP